MPVQISNDADVRDFAYNSFNKLEIREGCKPSYKSYTYLWLITWAPTQPVATRPLAIQKDGTWYTYGWDLTKNICEIFGPSGYIRSTYVYTPFGNVTASGDVNQPIQWSSEYYDNELALVYYNYRHYNPTDGRWINRDPIAEQGGRNLYGFVGNKTIIFVDCIGQIPILIPIILGLAVSSCSLLNNNLKYNFSASSFLKEVAECGQYFWGIEWRLSPTPKQYGVISQVVRFSGELYKVSSPKINYLQNFGKYHKLVQLAIKN